MPEQSLKEKYYRDLSALFVSAFSKQPSQIMDLRSDGSNRKLLRLKSGDFSAVGVYGPDRLENNAFVGFSRHFRSLGLPVPEIYAYDETSKVYLETDLGDSTLFDTLISMRKEESFPPGAIELYKKSLLQLSRFQTEGGKNLNYRLCYPRDAFDRQSITWDLNYFKYYFVKLGGIAFNEQKLEDDYSALTDLLVSARNDFFLYRDFQSRNIMVMNGEVFFIDYQGGRRGALQYDVASLLFDAKADLTPEARAELLDYYLSLPEIKSVTDREEFMKFYYAFIYIRIMQAMGAYGLRGFYEKKTHFLQSVPYVIKNLEWLLSNAQMPVKLPELNRVFKKIVASTYLRNFGSKKLGLTLKVLSFSYKNGIPQDFSGHNGGFVFDCRCLPNPGREERYKSLTGRDKEVAVYLQSSPEVEKFFQNAFSLASLAIDNYLSRNFTDLSVCFGCTGGQHRSVYMAEKLAAAFRGRKGIKVELKHTQIRK
ncbi:MAG: RNase adapter RapZ [Elusimicrobiota bacterium]